MEFFFFSAPGQVLIREWARLGMAGDEKGKGDDYEKARSRGYGLRLPVRSRVFRVWQDFWEIFRNA